jgi:cysteine-rich repeat protein
LLIVAPAVTAPSHVPVQFYDENSNLLIGCDGVVRNETTGTVLKLEPEADGIYDVQADPGDKLLFNVGDPGRGYFALERIVPTIGTIDVVLLGAPANDTCATGGALGVPGTATGSTVGAGSDPEAIAVGFCGTSVSNPSAGVWYDVVGTGNTITASTCNPGTDYDSKLTVYCMDCVELACVGGNDDQLGGFDPACDTTGIGLNRGSTISWCSQAGNTYRVFVHGFLASVGNFELTVTDDGQTCTGAVECAPPVPTGACCNCLNPPFNCTTETQAVCEAMGSDYQGDDSDCQVAGAPAAPIVDPVELPLPDNVDEGVQTTISVADDFQIADLDVDFVLTHTFLGDIEISLTHPSGAPTVMLWDNDCGGNDDMDVLMDDDGPDVVCATPTVGSVNPASTAGESLSAFNGLGSAGDWVLTIADTLAGDIGTLNQWSLHFTPGVSACPDPPVCGNGILEDGEDCDDGNNVNGDGCSDHCCIEGGSDDEGNDEDEDNDDSSDWELETVDTERDGEVHMGLTGTSPIDDDPLRTTDTDDSDPAEVQEQRGDARRPRDVGGRRNGL